VTSSSALQKRDYSWRTAAFRVDRVLAAVPGQVSRADWPFLVRWCAAPLVAVDLGAPAALLRARRTVALLLLAISKIGKTFFAAAMS